MMTVRDLIAELQKWPETAVVHIDISRTEGIGWEGDRVVRGLDGVRWQSGFAAVALDAQSYEDAQADKKNWPTQDIDTNPAT